VTIRQAEYRGLLRRTIITTVLCIVAVLICYLWIDRPVAFFVYRHRINAIRVFSMADLSAARSSELVGSGLDDLNGSPGVGAISALAEGAARRVYQLNRCR
jgi:hypothetical protein